MGVAVLEGYVDDYKVVDVVKVLSDALSGDVGMNIANDKVTSRSDAYLVCNVTRKDELSVVPSQFDLELLVSGSGEYMSLSTYSLAVDVDVVTLGIVHEVLGGGALNEGDACVSLVGP